jgi:hypothetical protein
MAADDVFPAEMPDHPSSPISPLDGDTAERLLSGRLDPDDAPPAYAGVARLLRAAAAPAGPDELASLAGKEEALALFRAARAGTAGIGDRPAGAGRWSGSPGRPAGLGGRLGSRGRPARVRRRLVAVALTGVLVAGGAAAGGAAATGLWTAGGVPSPGRLRSPTGGPAPERRVPARPRPGAASGPGPCRDPVGRGCCVRPGRARSPSAPGRSLATEAGAAPGAGEPPTGPSPRGPPRRARPRRASPRSPEPRSRTPASPSPRGQRRRRATARTTPARAEPAAGRPDAKGRAQAPDSLIIGSGGAHGGIGAVQH